MGRGLKRVVEPQKGRETEKDRDRERQKQRERHTHRANSANLGREKVKSPAYRGLLCEG